jgi:hypothetical protein
LNGKPAAYTLYGVIHKNADKNGLWRYKGYTFSIYRNLKRTLIGLIQRSPAGRSAKELNAIIHMDVQRALERYHNQGYLFCVKIGHTNYYFAKDFKRARRQLIARYNENQGYRLRLRGEVRELIFSKAGAILKDRIQQVCEEKGIDLTQRENDIVISAFLRPLLRAGRTDEDLHRYLKANPELVGFFSFIRTITPYRSEINQVKQKLDRFTLIAIFNELVLWIVEQLELETVSVAIDGSHCHQSRGNKRGIKIHAACLVEVGLPIGFVLMEDGMEYDLNSLVQLLKQIKSLNLEIEYVIADSLYDVGGFYYEVMMILGAEGIAPNRQHRLLSDLAPVGDTLLDCLQERLDAREAVILHNALRRDGKIKQRGRWRAVPDASISFDDKELWGQLLRYYPLTAWGSEERKALLKKRTVIERSFSILKLWLDMDGIRTKPHTRRWNTFASFISMLTISILSLLTGLPSLLLKIRTFVV